MNKKLRSLIDRAERLFAEREEANEGLRDLRKEMKGEGYDSAQIMKLAQLSHDDKKRAKLAAANEVLSLYNRESGLGLDLGLDEIPEPDRAATSSVPAGHGARGKGAVAEPIPQSEAGASTRKDDDASGSTRVIRAASGPASPASDTASPAGASPPNCAADCDPAPDAASPRSGPAGEPDPLDELVEIGQAMGDYDAPGYVPPPDIAEHRAKVLAGEPDDGLRIPAFLRRERVSA